MFCNFQRPQKPAIWTAGADQSAKKVSMKSYNVLIVFLCSFLYVFTSVHTQDLPRFSEWLDDSQFVLEKNNGQTVRVNAQTGREAPYRMEKTKSAVDFLPPNLRSSLRTAAITSNGDKVIVNDRNDLYYLSLGDKEPRQITATSAPEQNPVFSPDGQKVAYTREYNLFVLDLETGLERQLTTDGGGLVYNGWASWVYYEEILGRSSRYRAFYWSPDSERIAYLRFEDHPTPEFPIFHHEGDDMTHGMLEKTRYPKAGDPLPLVKLGVVEIETGATTWMTQNPDLAYTAWIFWTPAGEQLLYQQMNRDQNLLHIYRADPATGKAEKIYEEAQSTWVEFFKEIHFLADGQSFILRSNRDGWYNLYHYGLDGRLIRRLTNNEWRVTGLERIDETNRRVFFMGTGGDGTERHLFTVGLDGGSQKQLTEGAGIHTVELSPDGAYFIDEFSSINNPGEMHLRSTAGGPSRLLGADKTDNNRERDLKVEQFAIRTEDGFELPAQWVLPAGFDPAKKYPVIFRVYGGPNSEGVYNRYSDYSRDANIEKGAIRFTVDHRGSGKFGKKGLDYMHRNLGKWEMNDYIEAVKWLRQQGFIDETRVGIQGSSYGGYVTALALTYGADYFTHGISSYPVTDWRLYDNVYTERYMDTPEDNPEGYRFGAVMTHAGNLQGRLLLVHGTIDDNVHFQNTVQLVSELQDLGKDFEVMFYPGGRHGWGGPKRYHYLDLIDKFWDRHFFSNK